MEDKIIFEKINLLLDNGLANKDGSKVTSFYGYKGFLISLNQNGDQIIADIVKVLKNKLSKKDAINIERIRELFLNWLIENLSENLNIKNTLTNLINSLKQESQKKVRLYFGVIGLSLKKDFIISKNYKIITKNKFLKNSRKKLHSNVFKELKKDMSNFIIVAEDYGDVKSLLTFHREEIDRKLNILRFYMPMLTPSGFKYYIKIVNFLYNDSYVAFGINDTGEGIFEKGASDELVELFDFDSSKFSPNKKTIRMLLNQLQYKSLCNVLESKNDLSSAIEMAINWGALISSDHHFQNKFLYIVFSFEVLFTNENNNYSSIAAAVSEKVALLIGIKGKREELFKYIKDLYDKRSKIVHGSSSGAIITKNDIRTGHEILFACVIKIANLIIKYSWTKKEDLNNYFLEKKFR